MDAETGAVASVLFFESGTFLAMFVVGVVTAALGVLQRAGRARGAFLWHDVSSMPGYMRYTPYGSIPAGAAIALAAVAGEYGLRDRTAETALLLGSAFALFGVAAWLMWKRPSWIKPRWIREREADRRPSVRYIAVPAWLYRTLWAIWLLVLIVGLFFERSLTFAAPLGFGLMTLLALTPSSRGEGAKPVGWAGS